MVMKVLQQHKLFAKLSKCLFAQTELLFLGHIVGRDGVRVDPKKVSVVKDWPVPTNRCVSSLKTYLRLHSLHCLVCLSTRCYALA